MPKLTNNEWATKLQVIGPYRCKCRHVLVPAHGHPYHPHIRGCAAPCAVVEQPNGELGPTTTGARVHIPMHRELDDVLRQLYKDLGGKDVKLDIPAPFDGLQVFNGDRIKPYVNQERQAACAFPIPIERTGPMRVAGKSAHSRGDRGRTWVAVGEGG